MYGTYISHFHQASSFLLSKLLSKSKKCIVFLIAQNIYIFFFNLWVQKPLTAIRVVVSRSQRALVKQGGNGVAVQNTQLLPCFSKHQSEMLYWREAPVRTGGRFGPSPGLCPGQSRTPVSVVCFMDRNTKPLMCMLRSRQTSQTLTNQSS